MPCKSFRFVIFVMAVVLLVPLISAQYVVLVGVDKSDPYHQVAVKLAKFHQTKYLLRFDPEQPGSIVSALRRINPTQVAVVLRPEQIHVNTVRRFLRMATTVDPDPFVDFEFGFITGATAKEALAFLKNIIRAPRGKPVGRVGRAVVGGGKGPCKSYRSTYKVGELGFPSTLLHFVAPHGKKGRDQAFLDKHLADLEGCNAIIMGGHGMPWMIGSGPQARDIAKLSLFPAVVFNYACYTGVTSIYPKRKYKSGNYQQLLKKIELEKSFAMAIIRAGVTAYVAYVNPRPAGPELTIDFQRVLAGCTLGASRRNDYAKIVLGYLGFGEFGITVPDWQAGKEIPVRKVDPVRHMMLAGATGGILFGDPAYRPFPVKKGALPLRTTVKRQGKKLYITLRIPSRVSYLWGADPFRKFAAKTRQMAMKLYDRIEIPKDLPRIRSITLLSATRAGEPISTLPTIWAIEKDQGKTFLHVKPGFARGGSGDVEIRLVAGPQKASISPPKPQPVTPGSKPTSPDLSKRKACIDCATQIGEHLLKSLADIKGENVYEGSAGVSLFFFELYGATGDKRWLQPARSLLGRSFLIEDKPGLYVGVAGVGQVCIDAWRVTKDKAYLDRARECARRIGEPKGTDIIFGAAGTGIFLLNLHTATREKCWLEKASALGDYLAKQARSKAGMVSWLVSKDSDRVYIGFAHGAAGIGYFLLDLHQATGKKSYLALAEGAARFVLQHAVKDEGDGLQWTKMEPARKKAWPVQWCHGSPGIGLFFLALYNTLEKEAGLTKYKQALAGCIAANKRNGRAFRGSGILCHGVGGNAELFLDVYRVTKEKEMLNAAILFARELVGPGGVKMQLNLGSGRKWSYGPAYMTGISGVGRFCLRRADPLKLGPASMVGK